jgi:hypothetical protein
MMEWITLRDTEPKPSKRKQKIGLHQLTSHDADADLMVLLALPSPAAMHLSSEHLWSCGNRTAPLNALPSVTAAGGFVC